MRRSVNVGIVDVMYNSGGICDLSVPEPVVIPREDAVATTIALIRVRMGMNVFFSRKQ